MKKNLRENNKGFSLVELIVVIAIMGILAVTLAPRLTQYVEKARKASDKEVVNSVLTASKLAFVDDEILLEFEAIAKGTGVEKTFALTEATATPSLYSINGKKWTIIDRDTDDEYLENKFIQEIVSVVGDFKLKSEDAGADTQIIVKYNTETKKTTVNLYYDYDATEDAAKDENADYSISDRD